MQLVGTTELRLFISPAELRQLADRFEQEAKTCTVGDDLPKLDCAVSGSPFTRLVLLCPQEIINDIWQVASKHKG